MYTYSAIEYHNPGSEVPVRTPLSLTLGRSSSGGTTTHLVEESVVS